MTSIAGTRMNYDPKTKADMARAAFTRLARSAQANTGKAAARRALAQVQTGGPVPAAPRKVRRPAAAAVPTWRNLAPRMGGRR